MLSAAGSFASPAPHCFPCAALASLCPLARPAALRCAAGACVPRRHSGSITSLSRLVGPFDLCCWTVLLRLACR